MIRRFLSVQEDRARGVQPPAARPTKGAFRALGAVLVPAPETGRRLGLNSRAMHALLGRLAAAQLLDVDAKRVVRLHTTLPVAWRVDGPVQYFPWHEGQLHPLLFPHRHRRSPKVTRSPTRCIDH